MVARTVAVALSSYNWHIFARYWWYCVLFCSYRAETLQYIRAKLLEFNSGIHNLPAESFVPP